MSIRFAAPPHALPWRMNPARARACGHFAANDNGEATNRAAIEAALRHFARHGIAAAQSARKHAEEAIQAGDRDGARHWLDICHTLDRRLACAVACHPAGSC